MAKAKPLKIGLALGSGGARGLAHIGVIKSLEKNNIPIDYIAGTSIGSVIGGLYAVGLSIEKIEEITLTLNWKKIFTLIDPVLRGGLIKGDNIKSFIESHIGNEKFENCRIPFSAVATDFKTGEIVILNEGEMIPAIRASLSIPLIFKPVELEGRTLADGGLAAPVPAEIVKKMGADLVIAVNLDKHYYDENRTTGWQDTVDDSLRILQHHLAYYCAKEADVVIEMDFSRENSLTSYLHGQNKILSGERSMEKKIPQLRHLIRERKKSTSKRFVDNFLKKMGKIKDSIVK
jgi:NTE family protein